MSTQTPGPTQAHDVWEAVADGFDRHTTPHTMAFGEQVLAPLDLGPGVRVLDVGAGSGGLAIPAARRGADVLAVDISPTMVRRLGDRAVAEGLTIAAQVGDGEALDLADDHVDVAVSLNGVSLFPDLAAGLRELVRVTRPGGEVLVATVGPLPQVEFVAFFLGAVQTAAAGSVPPPAGPLPPFRLADPAVFHRTLEAAGLHDVRIETAVWEQSFASVDDYLAMVMASNPIAGQVAAGLSDDQRGEVRAVLDRMLRERSGGGPGAVLRAEMRIGRGRV